MRQMSPQFDAEHARRWQDRDAAQCYAHRIPYPPETFAILRSLIADEPCAMLDIGCGTGNIARAMAPHVQRVDAVDLAAPMIEVGRSLPGGAHPNIDWQVAAAESALLTPPYALIVGGASLHWMDYEIVLPRFAATLHERGLLAVVRAIESATNPWDEEIKAITKRYSTAKAYVPFDMITIWERAGLYRPLGTITTQAIAFEQSIDHYVAGFHAQSDLTGAHIDAAAFDAEVRSVMTRYRPGGRVRRLVASELQWGKPLAPDENC